MVLGLMVKAQEVIAGKSARFPLRGLALLCFGLINSIQGRVCRFGRDGVQYAAMKMLCDSMSDSVIRINNC